MDADGDFVVAWTKVGSSPFAVYAQLFDQACAAQGAVLSVSDPMLDFVTDPPAVAMDADGDFVVAWTSVGIPPFAVFFRRYDSTGAPQGPITAASDPMLGFVGDPPDVAMAPDGRSAAPEADTPESQGHSGLTPPTQAATRTGVTSSAMWM